MDVRVLRYFITIVQEGGINAAADVLRIGQPTLSRQIRALEERLGVTLFLRGNRGRGLELTREGRLLYRRAREITELVDRTRLELVRAQEVEGDVHIAAAQSRLMAVVARAIVRVRREHPGIRFHMHDDFGDDIIDRLDDGLADFGVFVQPTDMGAYHHLDLPGEESMGLLMRRDHPLASSAVVTREQLTSIPLIVPKGSLSRNDLAGWLGDDSDSLDIIGTMNLSYNAGLLVAAGYGCAICLDGTADTTPGSPLCFRPLHPPVRTRLSIAWKRHQPLTRAAETFIATLTAMLE